MLGSKKLEFDGKTCSYVVEDTSVLAEKIRRYVVNFPSGREVVIMVIE